MYRHLNRFALLFVVLCVMDVSPAQKYELTIFFFTCGEVTMEAPAPNQFHFATNSTGLIDRIWPFDNQYTVTFDTASFGMRLYEKKIIQGSFKQKLKSEYNPETGTIVYNDTTVSRPDSCQTVLTLLARIRKQPAERLDTRWFPLEHEGRLFKARFLWADTTRLFVGGDSVLCDHYRIDFDLQEGKSKFLDQTDYFSEYITAPKAVKQLWVERNGERRIIKAAVTMHGITIEAFIKP